MLATSMTVFYLPVFFSEQLGFSGKQIGLLFAIQAVSGVVAAFPAGWGNDRVTSRLLVAGSLVLQAAGLALMAVNRLFWVFLPVYFLYAMANNVFRLSMDVQVLKTDDGETTGSRVGLYQTWRFGGLAVGIVVAGYLLRLLEFRHGLLLIAGTCLFLVSFSFFLPATRATRVKWSEYKADFFNRRVLAFAAWLFLFILHWGAEHTCYSLFLRTEFNLSYVGMGWYMCVEFGVMAITLICLAKYLNKSKHTFLLVVIGLAASGLGHIGMVFKPIAVSVAFRGLHGFGDAIIMLVMYVGVARLFDVQRLGGNAGLINLSMMLGMITGALIAGPVGERFGYGLPIWVSGLLTMLLILPILLVRKRNQSPSA